MPPDGGHGRRTSPTRCPKRSIPPAAWQIAASCASRAQHAAPLHQGGPLTARTMTGKSIVDSQFERAANLIHLDDYMRRILMRPFREVQVEVPVRKIGRASCRERV